MPPLGEDKQTILAKYGAYVRSLASNVRRQFRGAIELDELMSWGQVGLLEAAERFDPKVGVNFLTFAHYRIKGAIFDGLRKMGVLSGPDARRAAAGERVNTYLGSVSAQSSGGNRGGSVADDVRDISGAVTGLAMVFATSLEGTEGLQLADGAIPADERMELEQLKGRVKRAVARLPEKERKLLEGYYFHGKTLEEAGAPLGQSKSWASRLHARAIDRLKEMLGEEDEPAGERRQDHGGTAGRSGSAAALSDRAAEGAGAKPAAPGKAGPVKVRPGSGP